MGRRTRTIRSPAHNNSKCPDNVPWGVGGEGGGVIVRRSHSSKGGSRQVAGSVEVKGIVSEWGNARAGREGIQVVGLHGGGQGRHSTGLQWDPIIWPKVIKNQGGGRWGTAWVVAENRMVANTEWGGHTR